MNWGKWEKSKAVKFCDGCTTLIKPGDTYLLAKFSLPDEGTNISRLFSMNLCVQCVSDFDEFAHGKPGETTDEPV